MFIIHINLGQLIGYGLLLLAGLYVAVVIMLDALGRRRLRRRQGQ